MSIIHDALKKVQSKNPQASPFPEPPPAPASSSPSTVDLTPETTNRSLMILMAVVLTVTVVVIFAVIFKLAMDTTQHPKATAQPASAGGIKVEGVMDRDGKMVALINGDVYEEGQTVEGKVITAITFANVTVMGNNSKLILPIKHRDQAANAKP
ncbi:MAG: hypothetical protein WCO69_05610 [Candidatus Omnitrophota bacterium]